MNILMIHGIGQQRSTQQELLENWIRILHSASPGLLNDSSVNMAYYGTTLADWTKGRVTAAAEMGFNDTHVDFGNNEEIQFLTLALEEAVLKRGGREAEIEAALRDAELEAVPMDNFFTRRLVGLVRALEKISPAQGSLLMRVAKQGHTYLSSPGAGVAVDTIVRPYLKQGPQVIIAHSLGTVIAFKVLRELEKDWDNDEIPLMITMGSPLGLNVFKKALGPPRGKLPFIKRWINFLDPSDLVTLGKALDETTFGPGIENDGRVNNQTLNAHSVIGYLPHKGVVGALRETLKPPAKPKTRF